MPGVDAEGVDAEGVGAGVVFVYSGRAKINPIQAYHRRNKQIERTFRHNFYDAYRAEQNLSDRAAKTAWKAQKPTLDWHQVKSFGHVRHQ